MSRSYRVTATDDLLRDGNAAFQVPLEQALQELGYAPIEPDANLAVKLDLARKDVALVNTQLAEARQQIASLEARFDNATGIIEKLKKELIQWQKEANEAIDERIKTQQMNERLLGVMRQLHESAIKVVDVMSGGKP